MTTLKKQLQVEAASFDFLSLIRKETNGRMRTRLTALQNLKEGKSMVQTASHLKVARDRIRQWVRRFLANGVEGLKELPGRGRKPKISAEQKLEVAQFIEKRSRSSKGGRLFGEDVVNFIRERFNQTYTLSSAYSIMHELKFSWITSRSIHPKCNRLAQEDFKKNLGKSRSFSS